MPSRFRSDRQILIVLPALVAVFGLVGSSTAQPTTLKQQLEGRIGDHQGRVAVAVKRLPDGESVFINGDEPMPTASLIKVAVMVEAYRQAEAGRIDLNDNITLREEDKVPGSGVLTKHFSAGARLSLRDAIRLMMAYSDNTATNLVVNQVGLAAVSEQMERLGLPQTKLHALVYRGDTSIYPDRSKQFGLGSTTAREMLTLLARLHAGKLASESATEEMLEHMRACESRNRLPRLLPAGTKIAHKTGSVTAVRADAGIIESPGGPIAVVVLTADNTDRRWSDDNAAEILAGRIARIAYDHFNRSAAPENADEPQILSFGAGGWFVEALQRTLNARLEPSPDLSVDGDFGPATEAAVEAFQESRGLAVTGDADVATWKALGPLITSDVVVTDPDRFDLDLREKRPADELEGTPFVTCQSWIVGDAATGEIVGGEQIDKPRDNASTTKLMTAWLTLRESQRHPGLLDEVAIVSRRAADTPGSTAKVQPGERLLVRDLLYGLLLPSGNDASVVLAEHLGDRFAPPDDAPKTDDPLPRFVAEMNRAAAELGMQNTHFANPHGLSHPDHKTTPRDLFRPGDETRRKRSDSPLRTDA